MVKRYTTGSTVLVFLVPKYPPVLVFDRFDSSPQLTVGYPRKSQALLVQISATERGGLTWLS